jgi:putative membrane protein
MKRAKVIITVVISLLVLVLILQNTQAVETKILFMTVTMPRALLLFVTFIIGFVAGLIAMSFLTAGPSEPQGKSH